MEITALVIQRTRAPTLFARSVTATAAKFFASREVNMFVAIFAVASKIMFAQQLNHTFTDADNAIVQYLIVRGRCPQGAVKVTCDIMPSCLISVPQFAALRSSLEYRFLIVVHSIDKLDVFSM